MCVRQLLLSLCMAFSVYAQEAIDVNHIFSTLTLSLDERVDYLLQIGESTELAIAAGSVLTSDIPAMGRDGLSRLTKEADRAIEEIRSLPNAYKANRAEVLGKLLRYYGIFRCFDIALESAQASGEQTSLEQVFDRYVPRVIQATAERQREITIEAGLLIGEMRQAGDFERSITVDKVIGLAVKDASVQGLLQGAEKGVDGFWYEGVSGNLIFICDNFAKRGMVSLVLSRTTKTLSINPVLILAKKPIK